MELTEEKAVQLLNQELYIHWVLKKSGRIPLVVYQQVADQEIIRQCGSTVVHSTYAYTNNDIKKFQLFSANSAIEYLKNGLPFLAFLSFKGYRLAGGSLTTSIYCVNSGRYGDAKYERTRHHDYDFFIVVDVPADLNNFNREDYLKRAAETIYVCLLNELETFLTKFQQTFPRSKLLITRNMDATTISLTGVDRELASIQIIHRVYTDEGELLGGFDLAASQVLYDGREIKMTRLADATFQTGVIPIDFSCASKSWTHRIEKYCTRKGFDAWIPGLDTAASIRVLQRDHDFIERSLPRVDPTAKPVMEEPIHDKVYQKGSYRPVFFADTGISLAASMNQYLYLIYPKADVLRQVDERFTDHNDYSDVFVPISDQETLAAQNFKLLMAKKPIIVGCSNITDFINRNFNMLDLDVPFRRAVHNPSRFTKQNFKFYFDDKATEAAMTVFNNDYDGYEQCIVQKLVALNAHYKGTISFLKEGIRWRVREPGTQISGTFNPIKFKRTTFYPLLVERNFDGHVIAQRQLYNGYVLDINWTLKRPIVAALKHKEPDCLLTQTLPVDLIKLIFNWLDIISVNGMLQ